MTLPSAACDQGSDLVSAVESLGDELPPGATNGTNDQEVHSEGCSPTDRASAAATPAGWAQT
ncbi:MAG: hypothetical protein ABI785_10875 [Gemmatimonadales bacterium]